ncbi:cob(I)yrinic acid a,c-diamide adenosyltransferase [Bacillus sp. NMCN1]|uniref:cob(I)yrinic acid a,c-diamide adenosyltransferase n=1 Tax=Bacillus sp. NMCN1 TaxID=2108536 RepID=UPI000D02B83E|nr:cob(I)yrinic acid a,c-diamide adenosyltransferase [Bacillus sp. NMCN1]PRR90727.1 ATP:cob(I)alamin adenosyltransferase [Bacillus sp. NMCN1]
MKLYTKTGDQGQTGLIGGRADKDDVRVEAYGTFDCGDDLAAVKPRKEGKLTAASVAVLEQRMDVYVEEATPLTKFILPGGQEGAALLHVARTVVRRAERHIVTLAKQEEIPSVALTYVNRLSDYLFAAARIVNHRLGEPDVEYERSADVFRSN